MQYAGEQPPLDHIDAEILLRLGKYPLYSVRTIAESLEIPASTIYFHLVEKIENKRSCFVGFSCTNQRVAAEASQFLKLVAPGV
jgi:hypothetical protein